MKYATVTGYENWRAVARNLLREEVGPEDIVWTEASEAQPGLAGLFEEPGEPGPPTKAVTRVPKEFLELAPIVACHREPKRWAVLYRVLYRVTHGEHNLLQIEVDPDIRQLILMDKAVKRDMHKMKAFVRFRKVDQDGEESYVAWHRPDHYILEQVAPFFVRRFGVMRWAILTPDRSAYWDTESLEYGPGVPAGKAPGEDALEDLWRSYYASVFNPARIKIRKMKQELPTRHWPTLPETRIIPELIRTAAERVEEMRDHQPRSASPYVQIGASIPALRASVHECRGCDLYQFAHQPVFGDGPPDTPVLFLGEQPGDQDDVQGLPFSGPAGKLLDRALAEAGIRRSAVYITNVVKHFKFEQRGPRRIHVKANGTEQAACRPWLEAEIAALQPKLIVCLGATAAQAMLGRAVTISRERGSFRPHAKADQLFITTHPAAILRVPDPEMQQREYERFVDELKRVKQRIDELVPQAA